MANLISVLISVNDLKISLYNKGFDQDYYYKKLNYFIINIKNKDKNKNYVLRV